MALWIAFPLCVLIGAVVGFAGMTLMIRRVRR
jgi:hypothetical protein